MPDPFQIKAAAFDLDGTLLTSNRAISPRNLEALRSLHKKGIKIIISSGRMTYSITRVCSSIDVPWSMIAYNGAKLLEKEGDGWHPRFAMSLEPAAVESVLEMCSRERAFVHLCFEDRLYAFQPDGDFGFCSLYTNQTGMEYHSRDTDASGLPRSGITKMVLIAAPAERERIHAEVYDDLSRQCSVVKSQPEYLEFLPMGVTKAHALKIWCESHSVLPKQIFAMGDAENDLDMLEFAGMGMATANATAGLKKLFPHVSKWTEDEDAVAREVEIVLSSPGLSPPARVSAALRPRGP